MSLQLYNTLTRKKEEFQPLAPGKVKIYVCGVTVWDYCHLGHARASIVFDMIVRYLHHIGYDVQYVRNLTDVDDKIIARAAKEGRGWQDVSGQFIADYEVGMEKLGCLPPSIQPKASEHIQGMVALIEKLIAGGHAYAADGDVFFAVRSFPSYGKLSGKNIEDLESGARVEVQESKRDPLDFALWKAAKPGEPAWESPWGQGRPGWHIECSCMGMKYLGETFDIHGGGRDLIFPHHENEIAQSEGATGKPFVRYWLHNGTLDVGTEKMSKSLGNYFSVADVLAHHHPEVVRYFLLSANYRSPLMYTADALHEAKVGLDRLYETAARVEAAQLGLTDPVKEGQKLEEWTESFSAAMDDDFNTPKAYAVFFDSAREVNRALDATHVDGAIVAAWCSFRQKVASVLGFGGLDPADYRRVQTAYATGKTGVSPAQVEQLLADRKAARAAKDFKKSDAIRDQLASLGVTIKDRPDGTTEWKING